MKKFEKNIAKNKKKLLEKSSYWKHLLSNDIQEVKKEGKILLKSFQNFIKSLSGFEKALLITAFLMNFVFLLLISIQLKKNEKETLLELITDAELIENQELTQNQQTEETENIDISKISITAFNEANKNLKHSAENIKSLDEILKERDLQDASQTSKDDKKIDETDFSSSEEKIEKKTQTSHNQEVTNKNTLIKYDLSDRDLQGDLPNPIFTCQEYGKIIVIIKVNQKGIVISASIDEKNTTNLNGCLVDNALKYAKQTRFNVVSGREIQQGTITYFFQPK